MVTCPRVVRCWWRPWLGMIGLAILKVKSKRGAIAKQVSQNTKSFWLVFNEGSNEFDPCKTDR